jgi:hypothetical protein
MNTSRLYLKPLTLGAVIFLFVAGSAHAVPITGQIGFSGAGVVTQNTLAFNNPVTVSYTAGDFGLIPLGTTTGFSSISVTPSVGPVVPIWMIALDGTTYSFDLTAMTVASISSSEVFMQGFGIYRITGVIQREATVGVLTVRGTGADFTYTLSVSEPLPVPEPHTVGFLCVGLAALGVMRSRRRKVSRAS